MSTSILTFVAVTILQFYILTSSLIAISVLPMNEKERVAIIGGDNVYLIHLSTEFSIWSHLGGSFGTAVANRLGVGLRNFDQIHEDSEFDSNIRVWVFDEIVNGRSLVEIINTDHENIKYLPGITLPTNILALRDIHEAVRSCDYVFIVTPHQHVHSVLKTLLEDDSGKPLISPSAIIVSLIKGLKVSSSSGPELISDIIKTTLKTSHVAVAMGANIASEVASNQFVETTVASSEAAVAEKVVRLFRLAGLHSRACSDVATVELCGALKNIVAMGAGFCDGLNLGHSSKAAVLRQGLHEIGEFCKLVSPNTFKAETLLESCGFPDLVASSYGGRNRLCSYEFIRRLQQKQKESLQATVQQIESSQPPKTEAIIGSDLKDETNPLLLTKEMHEDEALRVKNASLQQWNRIEAELLNGQSLQGLETCQQVYEYLSRAPLPESTFVAPAIHSSSKTSMSLAIDSFPLFRNIYNVAFLGADPQTLFNNWY